MSGKSAKQRRRDGVGGGGNDDRDRAGAVGGEPKTMRDWALHYARRGWPVFAVKRDGSAQLGEAFNGHLGTTDPLQVQTIWAQWPDANIALPTGAATGFVVVECPPGVTQRAANVLLPATCIFTNTSGYRFYVYRVHRDGRPCPTYRIDDAIVHGDGDYVLLPPSVAERSHGDAEPAHRQDAEYS